MVSQLSINQDSVAPVLMIELLQHEEFAMFLLAGIRQFWIERNHGELCVVETRGKRH